MWACYLLSLILFISIVIISLIIHCGTHFYSIGVPSNHPQTDVGSFFVYQNFQTIKNNEPIRDVFIYWREIEETNKCDMPHEYYITCSPTTLDSDKTNVTVSFFTQRSSTNYVQFQNLSTIIGYTFLVYASNKHGLSSEHSIINVPSEYDRTHKTLSLTKVLNNQNNFNMSWNNDQKNSNHRYTLFWCKKNPNWQYLCKGYLNWIHIPGTESSYLLTIEDDKIDYNFAISENWEFLDPSKQITTRSSGMFFESCSILSNQFTIDRIEFIHIENVTSTSIEIIWMLECSDLVDEVLGYQVDYCIINSNYSFLCSGFYARKYIDLPTDEKRKPDYKITMYGDMTAVVITGLHPKTNYMFTINANSYKGMGVLSNPIFVTTLETGN